MLVLLMLRIDAEFQLNQLLTESWFDLAHSSSHSKGIFHLTVFNARILKQREFYVKYLFEFYY